MKRHSLLLAAALAVSCTYGGYEPTEGAEAPLLPMDTSGARPPGPALRPGTATGPVGPAAAGSEVTGVITVAPELAARTRPTDVLYILARSAPPGPAVAVKRIANPVYPVRYSVGSRDVMGSPDALSGKLWVLVRLDRDGNAGRPEPGDMEGSFVRNPVVLGASGVDIVIDREYGPEAALPAPSTAAFPGAHATGAPAPSTGHLPPPHGTAAFPGAHATGAPAPSTGHLPPPHGTAAFPGAHATGAPVPSTGHLPPPHGTAAPIGRGTGAP